MNKIVAWTKLAASSEDDWAWDMVGFFFPSPNQSPFL